MKIYGFATYNVLKVLATAEELGLDYDYMELDPMKGEHKTPEHLARHPMGKVPVIEEDGKYLYESNSICRYLAVREGSLLYAGSAREKALIDQQVDIITHHVGRWLGNYFYEDVVKKNYLKLPASEEALEEAAELLAGSLPLLDGPLKTQPFMLGEQITIADIIGFAFCSVTEITSASIDKYTHLKKWYDAMKARPGISRAMIYMPG